jgi:NADH-quinone oxidoreductase subunit J
MMFALAEAAGSQAALSGALFYVFALVTGVSAVVVVASRNIVRTAVALLFTLVGVAGLFFLLHAEFLAAVQLVVYAGATLILIIFGVMLTSKSPFARFQPKGREVVAAAVIGVVMFAALTAAIVALPAKSEPATLPASYPIAQLGTELLGNYLVPFELSSILLLLTMIGAAYLAKARRRDDGGSGESDSTLSQQARQWS